MHSAWHGMHTAVLQSPACFCGDKSCLAVSSPLLLLTCQGQGPRGGTVLVIEESGGASVLIPAGGIRRGGQGRERPPGSDTDCLCWHSCPRLHCTRSHPVSHHWRHQWQQGVPGPVHQAVGQAAGCISWLLCCGTPQVLCRATLPSPRPDTLSSSLTWPCGHGQRHIEDRPMVVEQRGIEGAPCQQ